MEGKTFDQTRGLPEKDSRFRGLVHLAHESREKPVDSLKHALLGRQSFLDLGRFEDGLQVHPFLLDCDPLVDSVVQGIEVFLRLHCLLPDDAGIPVAENHVHLRQVFVQESIQIVHLGQDPDSFCVFVLDYSESDLFPACVDRLPLVDELVLTGGSERDRDNVIHVLDHV